MSEPILVNASDEETKWKVYIVSEDDPSISLIASLSDDVSLDFNNNWERVIGESGGGFLSKFSQITGLGTGQLTTIPMRNTGTEPVAFSIPLSFRVKSNPIKEVVEPIKALQKLTLPDKKLVMIGQSPTVSIKVSTFFKMKKLGITNLSITKSRNLIKYNGKYYPIKVSVNVSLVKIDFLVRDDIDDLFFT